MKSPWLYKSNLIISHTLCTQGTFQSTLSLSITKQVTSKEKTEERDQSSLALRIVSYFLCETLAWVLMRRDSKVFD